MSSALRAGLVAGWLAVVLSAPAAAQVDFGVGFSPGDGMMDTSTITYRFVKDSRVEQVIEYFYGPQPSSETVHPLLAGTTDQYVSPSTYTVSVSSIARENIEAIRRMAETGFGRHELIRLIIISQRSPKAPVPMRRLTELRESRRKPLMEIAAMFGLDYKREVWLESDKIYTEIYGTP